MGTIRSGSNLSVEISATGVRAAAVAREGAGARVTVCESRPIPPSSTPEARRVGLASALRDIAQAVDEGPGRDTIREVRVVVSGSALTLRLLRIPPMPAREIPAAVRYRLPEICAVPVENLALDILCCGGGRRRGAGRMDVLVAAFERAELEEILGAFESAGLRPAAVIPLGVAMLMAESLPIEAAAEVDPAATPGTGTGEATRGVLNLGATHSCLIIERGGRILLTRDFGLGGDHFTQALARELELGLDEAEKIKCIHGIPDPSESAGPGEDPSLVPSIRNVLRPLVERLVAEVKRSIEFTFQEHGGPPLAALLITGGGAALRGLTSGLEEGLGVPVRLFRPRAELLFPAPALRARLEAEGKMDDPALACQSAPCLGAAWEDPPINLLAPRGLSTSDPLGPRAAALAAAGILALGLYGVSLWRTDRRLDATLHAQEARIRVLAPRSADRDALSPEILRAVTGAIDFERTFQALDALVPPGVLIESIRLEPPEETSPTGARRPRVLRVEGISAGAPEPAEQGLARLLGGVEQSGAFANVQRVRSGHAGRRDAAALGFAFTCNIQEEGARQEGAPPAEKP